VIADSAHPQAWSTVKGHQAFQVQVYAAAFKPSY
jgi:hypothetical protein